MVEGKYRITKGLHDI